MVSAGAARLVAVPPPARTVEEGGRSGAGATAARKRSRCGGRCQRGGGGRLWYWKAGKSYLEVEDERESLDFYPAV